MGANYLSKRFYSVYTRPKDRFLRTPTVMLALFSDVYFAVFTFTRHMLTS
jgi:hypothetical protein